MAEASAAVPSPGDLRHRRPPALVVAAVLGVVLVVLVALQTFVLQVFVVPSSSMATTVQSGDRIVVDKLAYRFGEIQRGDIIVFDGSQSWDFAAGSDAGSDYVKRVIGLPGDRVTCCDPDGRLTVNGVPLDEPYLHPGDAPSEDRFDIKVPPDRVWVMGDHRSESADSRAHIGDPGGGAIPVDSVIGRVFAVIWPASSFEVLDRPVEADSSG